MSQLSDIRSDVQSNWPTNYHSADLTDAKTDEFINTVQRWVCRGSLLMPDGKHIIHNFSWLKRETSGSTVDSQRRYALPEGDGTLWEFKSEISLELKNSSSYRVPLQRVYKRDVELFNRFRDTTDTGVPSHYTIDDHDIWLYPLPAHSLNGGSAWTMNLEYYGYPTNLSSDSDTNKITDDYPEILEYGATELGFRFGMDPEQAEYWRVKKIEMFLELVKVDQDYENSGIEMGIQPFTGQSLGFGMAGGASGVYWQDTPYS